LALGDDKSRSFIFVSSRHSAHSFEYSPYGLAGYVSGNDVVHAKAIADQIDAGVISVNAFNYNPVVPFGGFKQSGLGRENGAFGIRSYLELKSVG
jgi:NAD-dependent aldehyde dehydrogenases